MRLLIHFLSAALVAAVTAEAAAAAKAQREVYVVVEDGRVRGGTVVCARRHSGRLPLLETRSSSVKVHLQAASPSLLQSDNANEKEEQRAIVTTIWSFVATVAFAFCVVFPYKGRQATLDFITQGASRSNPASDVLS